VVAGLATIVITRLFAKIPVHTYTVMVLISPLHIGTVMQMYGQPSASAGYSEWKWLC
jgi:hypothetical protein